MRPRNDGTLTPTPKLRNPRPTPTPGVSVTLIHVMRDKAALIAKEAEVVRYRRMGYTWEEVAAFTGYTTPTGAYLAFKRAHQNAIREDIEEIRKLEESRLDALTATHLTKALDGDPKSTELLLKIMERRAKLLGLDMPIKQAIEVRTHDADSIDAEVARLARILDSVTSPEMGERASKAGATSTE